jgi:hypothetical protein
MRAISDATWRALTAIAELRDPSPARILEWNGFIYEANCLESLISAINTEMDKERKHGSNAHGTRGSIEAHA